MYPPRGGEVTAVDTAGAATEVFFHVLSTSAREPVLAHRHLLLSSGLSLGLSRSSTPPTVTVEIMVGRAGPNTGWLWFGRSGAKGKDAGPCRVLEV
jgi:hypothetical protein